MVNMFLEIKIVCCIIYTMKYLYTGSVDERLKGSKIKYWMLMCILRWGPTVYDNKSQPTVWLFWSHSIETSKVHILAFRNVSHICTTKEAPTLDTYALFTVNNLLCGNTKNDRYVNGAYLTVISLKSKENLKEIQNVYLEPRI